MGTRLGLAVLVLAAGVTPAPALAADAVDPLGDAVEAVEAVVVPRDPPPPEVSGRTSARDGRLRSGCRRYRFRYAVTTPHDDWSLEVSIVDRSGKGVMSAAMLGPNDPKSARVTYTLCRWATRPGRFRIRGKLTSYDGSEETVVRMPTTTFRLRRPK